MINNDTKARILFFLIYLFFGMFLLAVDHWCANVYGVALLAFSFWFYKWSGERAREVNDFKKRFMDAFK